MSKPGRRPSPYGLGSLYARYDASVASSVVISTGVSQWSDLSGNGNHLLQGTGANQPVYSGSGASSKITFNGTTQFLQTGVAALAQPITIYLVGQQNGWTTTHILFGGGTAGTIFLEQKTTSPDVRLRGSASALGLLAGWALSTPAVLAFVANGASSQQQLNRGSAISGTVDGTAMNGFTLGADAGGSGIGGGIFSEAILYAAAHSQGTINQVVAFLGAKWGISV